MSVTGVDKTLSEAMRLVYSATVAGILLESWYRCCQKEVGRRNSRRLREEGGQVASDTRDKPVDGGRGSQLSPISFTLTLEFWDASLVGRRVGHHVFDDRGPSWSRRRRGGGRQ